MRFIRALGSAAASSGHLSGQSVYRLSIANKEVCAIMRQATTSLGGDLRVLSAIASGRFPPVQNLRLALTYRKVTNGAALEWEVPSSDGTTTTSTTTAATTSTTTGTTTTAAAAAAVPQTVDLSALKSLTVVMTERYYYVGPPQSGMKATRVDPLVSVIVPSIAKAKLFHLKLDLPGSAIVLPSVLDLLSSPSMLSLTSLTFKPHDTGYHSSSRLSISQLVDDVLWRVVEDTNPFSHLESLHIGGHNSSNDSSGVVKLLRGVSGGHYLPCLRSLCLHGSLGIYGGTNSFTIVIDSRVPGPLPPHHLPVEGFQGLLYHPSTHPEHQHHQHPKQQPSPSCERSTPAHGTSHHRRFVVPPRLPPLRLPGVIRSSRLHL